MTNYCRFSLPYLPPYNWDRMIAFLAMRAIPGVEIVRDGAYWRTVRAYGEESENASEGEGSGSSKNGEGNENDKRSENGGSKSNESDKSSVGNKNENSNRIKNRGSQGSENSLEYLRTGWICAKNNPEKNQIEVEFSESLLPAQSYLEKRLAHLFDTQQDPATIGSKLESMNSYYANSFQPGTRIPGCYDGFEMACRAVLGQQISVKSASTLAGRMAATLGTPITTGVEGLDYLFPTPADIRAKAKEAPIEETLGVLGIIATRSRTILALARLLEQDPSAIEPCTQTSATPEEKIAALVELPGIGEWTAHYIAMRSMGYSDAFPATDLGIIKFLGTKKKKELIAAAEQWRPWRAYAVLNMWSTEQAAAQNNPKSKTKASAKEKAANKKTKKAETMSTRKKSETQKTDQTISTAWYETPFMGRVMVAATDKAIVGLWMEGQKYFGASMPAGTVEENPAHQLIQKAFNWLDRYFAGEKPRISELPLQPQGSEFRQVIWKLLCEIPYGKTSTYGDLATRAAAIMGKDHMASLAVGGAVGHNPISIIVPCHRVVGANGSLTGYAGGLDKKIALLKHEGIDTNKLIRPTKGTAL